MVVPEPGASVNASTALVSLTLTDSSGRFRLENVPPGRYYVMAGFVDAPTYYPGVAALDSARAIQVTSGAPVADINFPMIVGGGVTVSGRVVRPDGVTPLVPTVRLVGGGPPGLGSQATERPDGTFEFTKVRPGTYQLVPGSGTLAQPFTIVVGDRDIVGLEVQVVRTVEVSGTMVVENNAARPRINLTLMPFKGGITSPAFSLQVNGTFRVIGAGGATMSVSTTATSQSDGRFSLLMPEGERRLTLNVAGHSVQSLTYGATDLLREPLKVARGDTSEMRVTVLPLATSSPGGVGGVIGGVPGGVLGGIIAPPPNVGAGGAPPPPPPPQRIGGDVAQANLISSAPPVYPQQARDARVQGVVLLQVTIGREGMVQDIRVISGHPLLNDAAIDAVRQWRYRPQMLSGQPIEVVTTITVNFTMR
jgi:TonB family protein